MKLHVQRFIIVASCAVSVLALSAGQGWAAATCLTNVTPVIPAGGVPTTGAGAHSHTVTGQTEPNSPGSIIDEDISVLFHDHDVDLTTSPVGNHTHTVFGVMTGIITSDSGATAIGGDAFACGPNAFAFGQNATAIGENSDAIGFNATALGENAGAFGFNATAVGQGALADGTNATAIGQGSIAFGDATAVGQDALAAGLAVTAVGQEAVAVGIGSTAVGDSASAFFTLDSTAVGAGANADVSAFSSAFGAGSNVAFSIGSTATGAGAQAWASVGSTATGAGANAVLSFESTATGANASASLSVGSTATGANSNAVLSIGSTATGAYSDVSGTAFATASGFGSQVAPGTFGGVAYGAFATADGNEATAVGTDAYAARNGTAVGADSYAARNGTAVGADSYAARNGTAIGRGTQASAEGSVAIGRDSGGGAAVASLENEFVLGTANHTYTAPGITSTESRNRQSGPLEVATTDANGHLATDGGQIFRELGEQGAGIAIALALENPDLVGNERFGLAANLGFFEGNTALGVALMGVLGHNFVGEGERWAVSGGVGLSLNENNFGGQNTDRTVAGRAGVQVSW